MNEKEIEARETCKHNFPPDKKTWFFNNFLHDEWNLMMTTWWNDMKLSTFSTHFRIYFFIIESSVNPLNVEEGRKDEVRVGGRIKVVGLHQPHLVDYFSVISCFHIQKIIFMMKMKLCISWSNKVSIYLVGRI